MLNIDLSRFAPYEYAYRPGVRIGEFAYSLCGGPCAGMFIIEDSEMLNQLIRKCITAGVPYRVAGGLSNLLISDSYFDGIILLNRRGTVTQMIESDGSVILSAESGAPMAGVVNYCISNGLSGFEWACGLPGTVGGAVYGNAGAFGTEISDIFRSCVVIDGACETKKIVHSEMAFLYRSSILKRNRNDWVILEASFRLHKDDQETIRSKSEANREKRKQTQPFAERSLGSVFKNPEGYSAGKLIQDAGLKGFSIGGASVSMKHANFITTVNGVRSEDYRKLILYIQEKVFELYGIRLEPEIEFLGFEA